jgi:hypothetical protein
MSKVTDRLDNKQLVELAKKQYEQSKQINKFPANIVKFPSAGKVYPESSPLRKGEIEMRHMTAYDEDILTNSTYINNGVVFDKLLESLIITPGVNVDDLIYADKESLIVSARILGYGNDYTIMIKDKNDKLIKATIDLTKLNFKPFDLTSDENGCFTYQTQNGQEIKYRLLSESEVVSIDPEKQVSDYLGKSIYSVDGETNKKTIEDFLKYELIAIESRKLRTTIFNNVPGIESNTQAIGEDGGTYSAVFQFSADIFRV